MSDLSRPFEAVNERLRQQQSLFAVLDGAQFDNLPRDLLRFEWVHQSLHLDRGDNDPQQVLTAPHLV